jgi:hypothetical protein
MPAIRIFDSFFIELKKHTLLDLKIILKPWEPNNEIYHEINWSNILFSAQKSILYGVWNRTGKHESLKTCIRSFYRETFDRITNDQKVQLTEMIIWLSFCCLPWFHDCRNDTFSSLFLKDLFCFWIPEKIGLPGVSYHFDPWKQIPSRNCHQVLFPFYFRWKIIFGLYWMQNCMLSSKNILYTV